MREQKNIKMNINSCKRDKQLKDTNQLQNQPKKKKRDCKEIKK